MRFDITIGETKHIKYKGLLNSTHFCYAGIVGNSFSLGISWMHAYKSINLYFPLDSDIISVNQKKFRVIEVTADKLILETH